MGAIKYGAVEAKTKAMSAGNLKKEDYEQLCSIRTVSEAVAYLKNTKSYGYIFAKVNEKELHRGDVERLLNGHLESCAEKLYKFVTDRNRKVIEYFFIRYEIEILKGIIRRIMSGEEVVLPEISPFFQKHLTIDFERLAGAYSIDTFIESLNGTRYQKALAPVNKIKERQTLFGVEMALDTYYFTYVHTTMKRIVKGNDSKVLERTLGTEMDILNIVWIYRCKRNTDISNELIYTFIIPYRYKLKKQEIADMVEAESYTQMIEIVRNTMYKSVFDDIDTRFIEQNYKEYLDNFYRKLVRKEAFSIASILATLYFAETEIKTLVNIIEGIRYGLSPEEIKEIVHFK